MEEEGDLELLIALVVDLEALVRPLIFILLYLRVTNVEDLFTPMYFVRHNFMVLMGFSGALVCLVAHFNKTFQTTVVLKMS